MATLSQRDLEQIEDFLRGLYAQRRVESLRWYVLTKLPALVGTNQNSWNHVVPGERQADVMAWPEQAEHDKFQSALARHVHEHPLIVYFLQTGDPTAYKISDFLTAKQFHNTALYDELYRGLGYEDQFAMNLQPLSPQWDTLVVARDKRSFTERDRSVLNLVRSHVAQAYRQARTLSRLARRVEARRRGPATSRVWLDRAGNIDHYPKRAARWIEQYFDELPTAPRRLPDAIERWLVLARAIHTGGMPEHVSAPLVVRRLGRQLVIHLAEDGEQEGVELLLEERTDPHALDVRPALPLTRREFQVLLAVEQGKRNLEIAVELGMQLGTVKKHLEHIFDKLGVDNRTAAVARLHEARPRSG